MKVQSLGVRVNGKGCIRGTMFMSTVPVPASRQPAQT